MIKKFILIMIMIISVFLSSCNKKAVEEDDKSDDIITYYFDQPDMAFISNMTLIENYEFDKATLEENGWEKRSDHSKRRAGWWNSDTISFNDSTAVFDASYHEEGMSGTYSNEGSSIENPEGFYGGAIMTKRKDFKYGYYEARIKMPNIQGFWGAFWLTNPNLYQETGVTGAEIDVVEAMFPPLNSVSSAIHYNYGDLHSETKHYQPEVDIYENYITYGVLWDETKYRFYVNGKCYRETVFGGPSQAEEYIILSMECGDDMTEDKALKSSMVVDYVRVYQFNKYL